VYLAVVFFPLAVLLESGILKANQFIANFAPRSLASCNRAAPFSRSLAP
jgi:hypothetical protein